MKKLYIVLCVLVLLLSLSVPIFAEETEITPSGVTETDTPRDDSSLYTWVESLWPYIFPADVIADNAGLIALFTMAAVALVVFAPLFLIFVCVTLSILSSFKRR